MADFTARQPVLMSTKASGYVWGHPWSGLPSLSVSLFAAPELPGNEVGSQCNRYREASQPQGGTHGCILLPLAWEKAELSQNPQWS